MKKGWEYLKNASDREVVEGIFDRKKHNESEPPEEEPDNDEPEEPKSFACPHCGKSIAYEPVEDAKEEHGRLDPKANDR
jgi:hypothetical protein